MSFTLKPNPLYDIDMIKLLKNSVFKIVSKQSLVKAQAWEKLYRDQCVQLNSNERDIGHSKMITFPNHFSAEEKGKAIIEAAQEIIGFLDGVENISKIVWERPKFFIGNDSCSWKYRVVVFIRDY